jgi:hypothetical protein
MFNIDRFKRYMADDNRPRQLSPPLQTPMHMEDECEVKTILDHAGSSINNLEYQVKWVGYNATWELMVYWRRLDDEFLREYHEDKGFRIYKWMWQFRYARASIYLPYCIYSPEDKRHIPVFCV